MSITSYCLIGSMLFGFFFGAGNLIFPVHLGQEAGAQTFIATIGFILMATGLPFLGVLAIGISNSGGLFGLASRVCRPWGYFFTSLLYLSIGPFFALPRTGSTSFEIGLSLFLPEEYRGICLFVFSLFFFGIALYLSLWPGRLMIWVGKVLNPLFLLLLGILIATSFLNPMGDVGAAAVHGAYLDKAFFKGFTEGYNTMDALAGLAFAMLVIDALKSLGVSSPKDLAISTAKAGMVSVVLMVIIYACLAHMGATSTGVFAVSENGGIALAQIANHYFQGPGSVLLALIVSVGCLKTAVGLTSSCAKTFAQMFPRSFSYRAYAIIFSVMGCAMANTGLTQIIRLAVPVLMFLYPLAMVLIFMGIFSRFFADSPLVYRLTTGVTTLFALCDGLASAPPFIRQLPLVQDILAGFAKVPLHDTGIAWLFPALAAFTLAFCIERLRNKSA